MTVLVRVDPLASRAAIEATIEQLIALLDTIDGDPDLEPDAEGEPSLGWTYSYSGNPVTVDRSQSDDREAEDEHDEDGGDDEPGGDEEPWLGRLETIGQERGTYAGLCPLTDAAYWQPMARPAAMVELTGAAIPVFLVR